MVQRVFIVFIGAVIAAYTFATWSASVVTSSPSISATIVPVGTEDTIVSASPSAESEYILPYPGILPDNPLYRVKLIRDRVLDFLIRDPVKRVEFNLLMADKRLNMGIFLAEKGNHALAEETVSKGEKYFVKVIDEMEGVKNQSRAMDPALIQKVEQSLEKHAMVVSELMQKSPEEQQSGYENSLTVIEQNTSRLTSFGN